MKIIIIGNYRKDKQESMDRFAKVLYLGYQQAGIISEIWSPSVWFAKLSKSTNTGLGKWLGYLDKLILFPLRLRFKLWTGEYAANDIRFHICDHSNSFYLNFLPKDRTIITCHDVLAIRGALGFVDAYCPASYSGKIFQKWILKNLSSAECLTAVSKFTLNQLYNLLPAKAINKKWKVVHNGFNDTFWRMDTDESTSILKNVNIALNNPYILHVGSNLIRKNRKMLLDMVHTLGNYYNGYICFAGQEIDEDLMAHAIFLGLEKRVVSVINPSHITLVALYSNCQAFIFPSFSEGFGWPIIEAQACGAPVITSNLEPFNEVAAKGALYADPHNSGDFAESFLELKDDNTKLQLVQQGYNNCLRFNAQEMINSYIDLHR